jgi:hypothetical protein
MLGQGLTAVRELVDPRVQRLDIEQALLIVGGGFQRNLQWSA